MGKGDQPTGQDASGTAPGPQGEGAVEVPVAQALGGGAAAGKREDERVPAWLDTTAQYTWRAVVLLVGGAALLYAATRLYLVSLPVILAVILATLCVPPARRLERLGLPRLAAAFLVVIGGIGSFVGILALIFPTFVEQGRQLVPAVISGVDSVLIWLEEGPIGYDREQIEQLINQGLAGLEGSFGTIASQVGSIAIAVGQTVAALTLAVVLLFFFVKDGEQIVAWFIKLVPEHHSNTVRAAGARGWVALSGFVRGTALVALIDALGIGIGLALLGIPAYLPLAVLVFFGGFIPVIGATVTGLLAVLVALASGGFTSALIVGGLVLVVQQVESNLLQPTIMRRAVALHPVVILAVLTAGAVLTGIIGAFLAVPLTAVAAAVGNELRLRHEVSKRGGVAGPTPIGGPGVDPTTVRVQFPEHTQLRAAARRRDGTPLRRARHRTRERIGAEGEVQDAQTTAGDQEPSGPSAGGTHVPRGFEPPDTTLTTADLRIPIRERGSVMRDEDTPGGDATGTAPAAGSDTPEGTGGGDPTDRRPGTV